MGNLRACLVIALTACGNDKATLDASVDAPPDSKVYMDAPAPMFDLSCTTKPAPTMATAQITVAGTVQEISLGTSGPMVGPLDGATVRACKQPGTSNCAMAANRYGTDMTDAQGAFSIGPIATSSMPLDTYLDMTNTGSRQTFLYPPQPIIADVNDIPMLTFSPLLLQFGAQFGCPQNDATNGIVVVFVTDCATTPISDSANLTLVIKQGGSVVTGTNVVDLSVINMQAGGAYLVCNVPANATTNVGATYMGTTLLAHDVKVVAGTTTITVVRPGYF